MRPSKVSGRRPSLWQVQLLAGGAAVAGYMALSSQHALQVGYQAIGAFGICCVLLGLYRRRPQSPAPWWLLVAGIATWLTGDALYFVLERAHGGQAPFPSVADVAYYAFYPLVALAHLLTLRRRLPGRDRTGLVDAALITVAAGVLSWLYLMAPYVRDQELDTLTKLASIGYPLGDLLLLALLVRLLLSPGRRVPSFRLLVVAFVLTLGADAVYGLQTLSGTYVSGGWVDAGWLLTYVLWGTAALHPSMNELTERAPLEASQAPRRRLAVMALAALSAPVLLLVRVQIGVTDEVAVLAAACLVMFVLVLLRLAGVLDELQKQRDRLQSAYAELEQVQADRRVLLAGTVAAGERERARLAADLHDGPIQRLAAVSLVLDRALLRLDRGDTVVAAELLERGHEELSQEVDGLRRIMSGLRPPVLDEAGLEAGVHDLFASFRQRTGVQGRVQVQLSSALAPDEQTVLYRVAQEALTNVAKHAGASSVSVELEEHEDRVELIVTDDGCGFDSRAAGVLLRDGHFGLAGMRERLQSAGGSFSIGPAPGRGTCVMAVLPLQTSARPGLVGALSDGPQGRPS